eukprot:TRINITY_DN42094_c0_g1_i3.p1 TRINITY_DN42094_c0_g1~~TRINITY_DN42094_c0_g1_i3.p1  ORF type:complete len:277 (+),score=28.57 TRINITY_DN42094_c0_g1_i3:64-894(+)
MLAIVLLHLAMAHAQSWPKFFIMMFENHGYDQVLSNPGWSGIIQNSLLLTSYYAVTHPSQPNYIAQAAGSYFNISTDNNVNLPYKNLVDLLDSHGHSWMAYQEDYTPQLNGDCNTIMGSGKYRRRHNPWMSFTDITGNLTRCQRIVNETVFESHVKANQLPEFSYYTPDIDNDSHNRDLDFSSNYLQNWLKTWYAPYPNSWKDVLFMITFDEDEKAENNHIVAFFLNQCVSPGTQGGNYTQYSVTRWVETNWNLGSLGTNDAIASAWNDAIPYKSC